jgi:hypothetical protein
MKKENMADGQVEKKVYVEPTLKKAHKLQDVTEGIAPVVTGGAVVPE